MDHQTRTEISLRQLFLPPNLLTLSRIALTLPIAWLIMAGTGQATLICFILITIAAITDFLDGYLARHLNQITPLGLILDPLADKFMAITIIIMLILSRDFSWWLASVIILRDLLILSGGAILSHRGGRIPPSTLTGKYYFAALAILLMTYIIRFDFGIGMFGYITIILLILSTIIYIRRFYYFIRTGADRIFKDKPLYIRLRAVAVIITTMIFLYRLYTDFLGGIIG
nr:CDP-alcohol phosphatidyltransferase family protein [candidate division Zixibacteria bacterium]